MIIFEWDTSSSRKIDNRKEDILILGKGLNQGLEGTLSAEKMHSINFTENNKTFCFSLNSFLFVTDTEIHKFKAKDSEIVLTPLCLGNISKQWSIDNMKQTGLNGYVYNLNVDYGAIVVDDILDIHKYLMKKNKMIQRFIKKVIVVAISFFSCKAIKCVSLNNHEFKIRPEIMNISSS